MAGETLKTLDERNQRKKEAREDIFVYAGFIQPGKHQILIKDKLTGHLYAREIVVDIRRRDIEPHPAPNLYNKTLGVHRYQTASGEEILDLDGSVFMNFKRYTKQNIMDCLKADMATSILEYFLDSEEEEEAIQEVLQRNYTSYCQFFHQVGAMYSNFPNVAMKDIKKVLQRIGVCEIEKAEAFVTSILKQYKEYRQEVNLEFLLNRMHFIEVLLMYV